MQLLVKSIVVQGMGSGWPQGHVGPHGNAGSASCCGLDANLLCTQYKTVSVERGEGTDKRQGYAAPECLLSMCQPS